MCKKEVQIQVLEGGVRRSIIIVVLSPKEERKENSELGLCDVLRCFLALRKGSQAGADKVSGK
jgi:hypothetical protein